MIAIVDYGVGNLFSLSSSVRSLGAEVRVTHEAVSYTHLDVYKRQTLYGNAAAGAWAKLKANFLHKF